MALISKTSGFLFQVLLVVGAVVVFSFIDPFGILISSKLTLKDTPISVESVREIGELISAEYYGEVVKSYTGEPTSVTEDYLNSLESSFEAYHTLTIDFIKNASEDETQNKKRLLKAFYSDNSSYSYDHFYQEFFNYIYLTKVKSKFNEDDFGKPIKERNLKTVLDWFRKNEKSTFSFEKYSLEYKTQKENNNLKLASKKRLVLLGRGTIKAGYRFNEFTQANFKYDKEKKQVHLVGLKAEILSQTINPWFSPEKAIPGFEFLIVGNKAKRDSEALLQVKQECLDKLLQKAKDAHLLTKAKENAVSSLESFFSLLIGESVSVNIHEDEFEFYMTIIQTDGTLSQYEREIIDEGLQYLIQNNDTEEAIRKAIDFLNSANALNKDKEKNYYSQLNRFQGLHHNLLNDGVLDEEDIRKLLQVRFLLTGEDKTYTQKIVQPTDSIYFTRLTKLSQASVREMYVGKNQSTLDMVWFPHVIEKVIANDSLYISKDSLDKPKLLNLIEGSLRKHKIDDFNALVYQLDSVDVQLNGTQNNKTSLYSITDKGQLNRVMLIHSSTQKQEYTEEDYAALLNFIEKRLNKKEHVENLEIVYTTKPNKTTNPQELESRVDSLVQSESRNTTEASKSNIQSDVIESALTEEVNQNKAKKKKGLFKWIGRKLKGENG